MRSSTTLQLKPAAAKEVGQSPMLMLDAFSESWLTIILVPAKCVLHPIHFNATMEDANATPTGQQKIITIDKLLCRQVSVVHASAGSAQGLSNLSKHSLGAVNVITIKPAQVTRTSGRPQ